MEDFVREQHVGFRTRGVWTAHDLSIFAHSVAGLYDALLAVRVTRRLQDSYFELMEHSVLPFGRFADAPEFFHMWKKALHLWRSGKLPFLILPSGELLPHSMVPRTQDILQNLSLYSKESERLRVHRARMASPGGFSFEGLGEIIKELRELLKDLWYRNKQEKVKGEIDILKAYLDTVRAHSDIEIPVPPHLREQKYLIDESMKNVGNLRQLEAAGKLENVGKNIDYKPK